MARDLAVKTIFKGIDQVTRPVRAMTRTVRTFARRTKAAAATIDRSLGKVTSTFRRTALASTVAVAGITAALTSAATAGANFEHTLVSAGAKFPGMVTMGTEAFNEIALVAKRMGRETEFSATQAADGLNFLAMAGFNARQSIAALPGVIDLATVAQLQLGEASDIASDTLGSFNLLTQDSIQLQKNLTRVNDVLAKTVTTSNTSVEQFFEAMKQSGAAAANAGGDIETYASAVGFLAQGGVKASQAGTTLKRMFLQLAAPTGDAARTLKHLGVEVTQLVDGKREMRDIIDIFGDLETSLEGLGTADRAQALRNIFGLIPIAGVNIMLNRGSDAWREYREQIRNAQGASTEMASIMRNTVRAHFIELLSAIEGVQIALFDLERDNIDAIIKKATLWTRSLITVIEANETLSKDVLRGLGQTLWDVIRALGTFIGIIIALRTVLLLLQITVAAVQVGIMAVNGAVWLVTAAMTAWTAIMRFRLVTVIIELIALLAGGLWRVLTVLGRALLPVVITAFKALWAVMLANPVIAIIAGIIALVAAGIWLYQNWDIVKETLFGVWNSMKERFQSIVDWFTTKLDFFTEIAKSVAAPFIDAWNSAKKLVADTKELARRTAAEVELTMTGQPAVAGGGAFVPPPSAPAPSPSVVTPMVTPAERAAAETSGIEQSAMELTLRTAEGTSAEVTKEKGPLKPKVRTTPSGGF